MSKRNSAIRQLAPDCEYIDNGGEITVISGTMPSDEKINAKIKEMEIAEPMRLLREKRDLLLRETDWTQNSDVPEATRNKWLAYRQALRDVPANYNNFGDVIWPTKPL